MADDDLKRLVQRRLLELSSSAQAASRRAQWAIAPETITHIADGRHSGMVSERLAAALARALDIPENRVRRVVGLPLVEDTRADSCTGPHMRVAGQRIGAPGPTAASGNRQSPGRGGAMLVA